MPPFLAAEMWTFGTARALVLDGVADQVLEQLDQLHLVGHDAGSGSWVTSAPLSSMAPRRLTSACCSASSLEVSSSSLPFVPTREIGQQVLDQPLHAAGAVHREGDELVGIGVELALVAPGQQLRVAGHHAQRLLQVVRGDVGELPQLLVRAVQLLHLLQKMRLGRLARADVADRRRHQDALGAFERAQHDLDRELAAVLAPRR